ncbi:MAG: RraA family protein [Pseudomonadota bacterium]
MTTGNENRPGQTGNPTSLNETETDLRKLETFLKESENPAEALKRLTGILSQHEPMKARPSSSEMRGGPGFRVKSSIPRVEAKHIDELRQFETTDISDALNRMFTMDPEIRNVTGSSSLYGPAVTVKVFPGDNLMVHKALDIAKPGDVIVIDTSGVAQNAVVGDMIGNKAKHKEIAGFIVDGLVRDLPGLTEIGLPMYARGVTAFGPLHRGPGELGYSVSCGGIVVNPGDAVCADESGIVVVRNEFAADTIQHLQTQKPTLESYVENVKKGVFSNDWVDRQLNQDKCLFE